jgi:hypothetical protein
VGTRSQDRCTLLRGQFGSDPPTTTAARAPLQSQEEGGDADPAAEGRDEPAAGGGAEPQDAGGRGVRARHAAGRVRALRQRAHRRLAAAARRQHAVVRQARRRRLRHGKGESACSLLDYLCRRRCLFIRSCQLTRLVWFVARAGRGAGSGASGGDDDGAHRSGRPAAAAPAAGASRGPPPGLRRHARGDGGELAAGRAAPGAGGGKRRRGETETEAEGARSAGGELRPVPWSVGVRRGPRAAVQGARVRLPHGAGHLHAQRPPRRRLPEVAVAARRLRHPQVRTTDRPPPDPLLRLHHFLPRRTPLRTFPPFSPPGHGTVRVLRTRTGVRFGVGAWFAFAALSLFVVPEPADRVRVLGGADLSVVISPSRAFCRRGDTPNLCCLPDAQ